MSWKARISCYWEGGTFQKRGQGQGDIPWFAFPTGDLGTPLSRTSKAQRPLLYSGMTQNDEGEGESENWRPRFSNTPFLHQ